MAVVWVIIVLGAIFFPFYVLAQLGSMRTEIERLQQQLAALQGVSSPRAVDPQALPSFVPQSVGVLPTERVTNEPPRVEVVVMPVAPVPSSTPATSWFTEDVLLKLGALLIMIAVGWFVSYAFVHEWISPFGRIVLGISVGVMVLAGGYWRVKHDVAQGTAIAVLGMATVLLTMFAARYIYDFFTPGIALLVMLAAVAFVAMMSVQYKIETLALTALVAGAGTPLLAHTATPDVFGLFTYLAIIFAGALVVAALLPSIAVVPTSLAIAFLYGLSYLSGDDQVAATVAMYFAFVFAVVFLLFTVLAVLRQRPPTFTSPLLTTTAIGLYVFVWVASVVAPALHTTVYLLWAAVFATGMSLLWQLPSMYRPLVYVQGLLTGAFVAIATMAYFEGPLLTVALLAELTAMIFVATRVLQAVSLARVLSVGYVGIVLLSLEHVFSSTWAIGVWHIDFLMMVLIGSVCMAVGAELRRAGDETRVDATLITTGALYGLALVWLITHSVLVVSVATAVSLVLYTILGLGLYIGGVRTVDRYAKLFGVCLIAGVVVRLLLVDIWDLDLALRIVAFFVIGVLFIAAALYTKRPISRHTT